jgi:hypothetical protein
MELIITAHDLKIHFSRANSRLSIFATRHSLAVAKEEKDVRTGTLGTKCTP